MPESLDKKWSETNHARTKDMTEILKQLNFSKLKHALFTWLLDKNAAIWLVHNESHSLLAVPTVKTLSHYLVQGLVENFHSLDGLFIITVIQQQLYPRIYKNESHGFC